MWPFSKRKVIPPAPVAIVAPDPRQELLMSLRAIEKQLAEFDAEFKRITYQHLTLTSTGKSVLCCKDPSEGQHVLASLKQIRRAGESLAVRRNRILAELAEQKVLEEASV